MDTRTATKPDIAAQIEAIKQHMPDTYAAIKSKAGEIGNKAYELVRRALRGEPNCFWAMERGRVVGTPFNMPDVNRDVAWYMVSFGCAYVCIWAPQGESNGAH